MASGDASAGERGRLLDWLDKRLPIRALIENQLTGYYPPKNLNAWYYFGVMALVVLGLQLLSGIFLAMHYKPDAASAFDSIERLMREVKWGWLIRYMHSTGASFFFIVVYLHMFRALLYGSYKAPREVLWILGMLVFLALMAEAFMGYVLPWGNMSFWAAQVIVNLFGTIPYIGAGLVEWIRGDYGIGDATLSRFFSLHVIAVPLGILLLVTLHLIALRTVGSNNPEGIEVKEATDAYGKPLDGIPFHPYYIVKDVLSVGVFLAVFAFVLFFSPTFGGYFLEPNNFEPANPSSTPEHIAPAWYFAPFYAILRAVPDQRLGAILMLLAVLSFLFLPWLDRSPVRSMRYKGGPSRVALVTFAASFVGLGYLGLQPADPLNVLLARLLTTLYFAYFWLMPVYSNAAGVRRVPARIRSR
ncbi:MAG TPA: cytochrome bc complex cytochrome b subunit [Steroidobacteraceae bacterium]|nr:cytochrome bc complex cytochrome b subunit [Steroidobacteraceae bacterium]